MANPKNVSVKFKTPPVAEVSIGVQFEPIEKLGVPALGTLWSRFKKDFPVTQEQAPLPPVSEKFGATIREPVPWEIKLENIPLVPRCWFLSKDSSELIQVQKDRFIHNWRKMGEDPGYPSYAPLRDRFAGELATFTRFLTDERLGELRANQCELTYIDHILAGSPGERHRSLSRICRLAADWPQSPDLAELESVRLEGRFVFPNLREPSGRLYINVSPAFRISDKSPIYLLYTVARGRPAGEGLEDIRPFLDKAHESLINLFLQITTPEIQATWGPEHGT